jgi:hypothetical protein
MRARGWHSSLLTIAVLALQVSVSALGIVGVCVDRPHTHGGVPAPDCLMHHSQPESTAPGASTHDHHHQHDESASTDMARLACTCSSDPITLMTPEIAVVPLGVPVVTPDLVVPSSPEHTDRTPDVRLVPLSPPPKPSLA